MIIIPIHLIDVKSIQPGDIIVTRNPVGKKHKDPVTITIDEVTPSRIYYYYNLDRSKHKSEYKKRQNIATASIQNIQDISHTRLNSKTPLNYTDLYVWVESTQDYNLIVDRIIKSNPIGKPKPKKTQPKQKQAAPVVNTSHYKQCPNCQSTRLLELSFRGDNLHTHTINAINDNEDQFSEDELTSYHCDITLVVCADCNNTIH